MLEINHRAKRHVNSKSIFFTLWWKKNISKMLWIFCENFHNKYPNLTLRHQYQHSRSNVHFDLYRKHENNNRSNTKRAWQNGEFEMPRLQKEIQETEKTNKKGFLVSLRKKLHKLITHWRLLNGWSCALRIQNVHFLLFRRCLTLLLYTLKSR